MRFGAASGAEYAGSTSRRSLCKLLALISSHCICLLGSCRQATPFRLALLPCRPGPSGPSWSRGAVHMQLQVATRAATHALQSLQLHASHACSCLSMRAHAIALAARTSCTCISRSSACALCLASCGLLLDTSCFINKVPVRQRLLARSARSACALMGIHHVALSPQCNCLARARQCALCIATCR